MVFNRRQRDECLGGEEGADDVSEEVDDDDIFDVLSKRRGAGQDERGRDGGKDEAGVRDARK